jgi:hypothetical protein
MASGVITKRQSEVWDVVAPTSEVPRRRHRPKLRLVHASNDEKSIEFEVMADELEESAAIVSSTRTLRNHPAYQGILALGDDAVPLLLKRLELSSNRPIWLRLLSSLTPYSPGAGHETIREASAAWLQWGRQRSRQD